MSSGSTTPAEPEDSARVQEARQALAEIKRRRQRAAHTWEDTTTPGDAHDEPAGDDDGGHA